MKKLLLLAILALGCGDRQLLICYQPDGSERLRLEHLYRAYPLSSYPGSMWAYSTSATSKWLYTPGPCQSLPEE